MRWRSAWRSAPSRSSWSAAGRDRRRPRTFASSSTRGADQLGMRDTLAADRTCMNSPVYADEALESRAHDLIRLDEPRALLERFMTLIRESGTPAEETAGRYLVERLESLG